MAKEEKGNMLVETIKKAFGIKTKKVANQPLNKDTTPLSLETKESRNSVTTTNNVNSSNKFYRAKDLKNNDLVQYSANSESKENLPIFDPFGDDNFDSNTSHTLNGNSLNSNTLDNYASTTKPTKSNKPTKLTTPTKITKLAECSIEVKDEEVFLDLEKVLNIPDEVLNLVSSEFCSEYQVLPIELVGDNLRIAFINQIHKRTVEKLLTSQYPKLKFTFVQSTEKFLLYHIGETYSGMHSRVAKEEEARVMREHALRVNELDSNSETVRELIFTHTKSLDSEQNRILSLISSSLCQMKRREATDLDIDFVTKTLASGIKQGFVHIHIRSERDWVLLHEYPMSLEVYQQIPRVLKVISGRESTDEKEMCTGKVKAQLVYGTKKTLVQLRINFLPTGEDRGISISIRLQDRQNFKHDLGSIGLTRQQREIFLNEICQTNNGLTLVVAPVNEGKNTTCISVLKEKHSLFPKQKYVTVEDPIEYDLSFATQAEVENTDGENAKSYADYIRTILRHNLNNLYIGEIRDEESAKMAARAADLGHFVLSTVHTSTACDAVSRLSSLGISLYQISNVLRVVVSQRLVKKICSECVKVVDEAKKGILRLDEYVDKLNWEADINFLKGSGKDSSGNVCRSCEGSGYRGVTAIFEILKLTRGLRKLIANGVSSDDLKFAAQKEGFKSLWYSGLEKVLLGETTLEQILFVLGGLPDEELEGLPQLGTLENKSFYDSFEDVLAN